MVFTRWKCNRVPVYALKAFTQDFPASAAIGLCTMVFLFKHASFCSEETERQKGWWVGYPYWRDPIARRNEAKYKQLILNNDVDITDLKWTGCTKEQLQRLRAIIQCHGPILEYVGCYTKGQGRDGMIGTQQQTPSA